MWIFSIINLWTSSMELYWNVLDFKTWPNFSIDITTVWNNRVQWETEIHPFWKQRQQLVSLSVWPPNTTSLLHTEINLWLLESIRRPAVGTGATQHTRMRQKTWRQRWEVGKRSTLDCSLNKALCLLLSPLSAIPSSLPVGGRLWVQRAVQPSCWMPAIGREGWWEIKEVPKFPRCSYGTGSEIMGQQELGTAHSSGQQICVDVSVRVGVCVLESGSINVSEELASAQQVCRQTPSICPSQSVWAR